MLLSKEKILCQPITLLSSNSNYEHIKRQLRFVYLIKTKDLRLQILLSKNVQKRNKVRMINDYCNLWFTCWLEYTCCPSWRSLQERWEPPGSSGSVPPCASSASTWSSSAVSVNLHLFYIWGTSAGTFSLHVLCGNEDTHHNTLRDRFQIETRWPQQCGASSNSQFWCRLHFSKKLWGEILIINTKRQPWMT